MLYTVKHTEGPSAGYTAAWISDGDAWIPSGLTAAAYAEQVAAEVNHNVPAAAAVVEAIDTEAEWAAFLEAEGL